jgi:hypothetical protein
LQATIAEASDSVKTIFLNCMIENLSGKVYCENHISFV